MIRLLSVVTVSLGAALLVSACGGEDDGSASSSKSKLGPECEKQYGSGGCCLELAGDVQTAKDACATQRKTIEDGIKTGKAATTYEAACKTANEAAQQAGSCTATGSGGASGDGGAVQLGPQCTAFYDTCCPDYLGHQFATIECEKMKAELLASGKVEEAETGCATMLESCTNK